MSHPVSFTLTGIPAELHWRNTPQDWHIEDFSDLRIEAGERTDWFIDPNGTFTASNAPVALFAAPEGDFRLSAKITVNFASTYDAGVLFLYVRDDIWAKACFEYSPQGSPMIVSVITRGTSDDCNSVVIEGSTVYLRVARIGVTFAIHYSLDGSRWQLVRYFTLGQSETLEPLQVGFSAQSPTGKQCQATFAEIHYQPGTLNDIRSGE